jgi:hypothetical protein
MNTWCPMVPLSFVGLAFRRSQCARASRSTHFNEGFGMIAS